MKILHLFALGFLSTTMSLSAQSNQDILAKISKEVSSNSEAYQLLEKATTTIGHRATGTENGKKAEDFAAAILQSYGYEVIFQPFNFKGWERKSLKLIINGQAVSAVALAYTPGIANVEAEMIDLGNGLEADYEKLRDQVSGKFVIASIGLIEGTSKDVKNLHRSEKTALAHRYGAKGIILFNQNKGEILLTGTASVDETITKIPAMNVSYESGNRIKQQIKSGKTMAYTMMLNDVYPAEGRNVIARKIGSSLPNEKIVLGGHLDSWDLATGAIDNGVGSFSVIDVARTYSKLNLENKRTIEFVLFMGEEVGLVGSTHYVKEALKDGSIDKIKAMSNMDMTINPKVYSTTNATNLKFLDEVANDVQQYIPNFNVKSDSWVGLHSDHQPFMLQGIPIVGLSQSQFKEGVLKCYHANCDTFDLVEEQGLKNNVLLETYLMYKLSNSEDFPFKRWTDEETKEQMIKGNLETPLRISGDWRWE